ncbi:glycogen debranching protein GlgX [Rheinheimera maricola]|uniref:Glycogen debranching protein GlgX n=1 Tax=Rheinheimera maricola TaxID=2793282 RepID=A0ABS7X6V9_9GAMM|nr:glycogen debranching protein GlgX [Rheinheimera maricola]MBZ9610934.1 glycogen debranching protein GlgX [Rheinheimera maricola]
MNQHIALLTSSVGSAAPLGATVVRTDNAAGISCWNFAVFAPDATALTLCLFQPDTEELLAELTFTARTGEIWHLQISGIEPGTLYAFKADGPCNAETGLVFDGERVLLDPYVKQLNRSLSFNERLYRTKSHYMLAKGVLHSAEFDWQGTVKPGIAREKTVIYEAHVKGMTMLHPEVPEELRGTYLGLCHPAVIKHLQQLGITTLQLLPVAAFMSEPRLNKLQLSNYWGYNPVSFFAPEPRYQLNDAVTEFKTLVRSYHQAGIEVILDVVFNHTAEAGEDGPLLSFRGLANKHYYLFESHADITDFSHNCNYTGCGNTLNVANPVVQKLVLDALRYWLTEMQVDGFRFDLATTLAREHKRFTPYAAFFQIIAQDPVLSSAKLIAEPWDVGPMGYQLGQFPPHWSELNDKCRDTFRAFWRADKGVLPEFTTRLLGSRDIFQKHHKPACCSVNYLTYHDGFTLHDLVSYKDKHNWLNGEENRDGHGHNLSCNHGVEGPSKDPTVLTNRYLHKRNLVATLMLSQGMIHWLGGDELSHTQRGNNNAYCQDNDISWLDWHLDSDEEDFLNFVRQMLTFRRTYGCFQQLSLLDDSYQLHGDKHQINWYLPDGSEKQQHDWHDPERFSCVFQISNKANKNSVLFVFNASDQLLNLHLPERAWQQLFDTSVNKGMLQKQAIPLQQYQQNAHSISVWR